MSTTELTLQMMFGNSLMLAVSILSIIIGISLLFLVYKMAKNRNREPILWVLLGFFANPLLAIILLLILGEDKK